MKCSCDAGWIHIQHPMKPLGVIMCSVPCATCNLDFIERGATITVTGNQSPVLPAITRHGAGWIRESQKP